ncbi:hypothetical protein HPB49_005212 [Dermacentor silvarum]|uniref:Uncharacterized protein n=1 Tax=Dermacentor silvarum TaxID=543639 RepID=A0ACB8DUN9_DERSI|nr:hypothetical protein HPB49_005212 [Dermacentor silvarum]
MEEMVLAKEEKLSLFIAASTRGLFTRSKLGASAGVYMDESVVIVHVELKDMKNMMEDMVKCFYSTTEQNFERKIDYQTDARENHFMEGCIHEVRLLQKWPLVALHRLGKLNHQLQSTDTSVYHFQVAICKVLQSEVLAASEASPKIALEKCFFPSSQ